MTTVQQVYTYMEQLAPPALAESWDNVGLLVDCGRPVTGILTALDITPEVVEEARELGCELIVSHHPVIFKPLRAMGPKDPAFLLAQNGISAICMHTNLDAAEGGVNDVLAGLLGLTDIAPFGEGNIGRVGSVQPMDARTLAQRCAQALHAHVKWVVAAGPIQKLAVIGGSGGDLLAQAKAAGADALLTGEAGHHDAHDARAMGIGLIAAGHYCTEFPVVTALTQKLARNFPALRVVCSQRDTEPFTYL